MRFFSLPDAFGVFTDAAAMDNNGMLVFASLYGRDTTMQQIIAQIQLGDDSELGLQRIRVSKTDSDQDLSDAWVKPGALIANPAMLDKLSGRVGSSKRSSDNRLAGGTLVHTFLFDQAVKHGTSDRSFLLFQKCGNVDANDHLWRNFKEKQRLPLLPEWKEPLLHKLTQDKQIIPLNCVGNIAGFEIRQPEADDFESFITQSIRDGSLAIAA